MNNFAVVLYTDGRIEYELKHESETLLEFCYRIIECDMIEIVRPVGLDKPFCMIVDEEGLLKESPMINVSGSYLYGMHNHLQPIVGNAIILKEGTDDLELLSAEEAYKKTLELIADRKKAYAQIKKAYVKLNGGIEQ